MGIIQTVVGAIVGWAFVIIAVGNAILWPVVAVIEWVQDRKRNRQS
ncbi:hypothetical protein ACIBJF_24190 [Streptomyces sp. NPDC050743]